MHETAQAGSAPAPYSWPWPDAIDGHPRTVTLIPAPCSVCFLNDPRRPSATLPWSRVRYDGLAYCAPHAIAAAAPPTTDPTTP
jgi:hypothetical protein